MSHAYITGRSLVPLPHGIIDALETTMSDISSNLVTTASEQSEKVGAVYQPTRCFAVECAAAPAIYKLRPHKPTST